MADVSIRMLGHFVVLLGGSDAGPKGRKARAIIALLALAPEGAVMRDRLADLLWGDRGEEQARASLRQALAEIRVTPIGGAGVVTINRDRVRFADERVETDCAGITAACERGDVNALAMHMDAVDGTLLTGFDGLSPDFDQWLRVERARHCERIVGGVLAQGPRLLAEATSSDLQAILRGLDMLEPANEVVARLGMEADDRDGDLAGLHRRYRRLSVDLQREFGARPSEETRALFARLTALDAARPPPKLAGSPIADTMPRTAPIVLVSPIVARGGGPIAADIAEIATDEIRVALGRHSEVRVATLDGLDLDRVEQVCSHAFAAYMLSGWVRELDGGTRVVLQLGNVRTRVIAWSGQIQIDPVGIAEAVERIVASSVGAVVPAIDRDLGAELHQRPERVLDDAVALYARGRHLVRTGRTLDVVREGMALLDQAIARDPAHVGARLLLVQLYNTDLFMQVAGHDVDAYRAKAFALAHEAAALDSGDARIAMKLAWCYLRRREWENSERRLAAALEATPYDADVINEGSHLHLLLGDMDRAGALMQRAFALNPFPPADYHADYAMLCAMRGEPEAAEEHFEAFGERRLLYVATRLANLSSLPRVDERRRVLRDELRARFAEAWCLKRVPGTADLLDWFDYTFVFRQPEHRAFWRDRLSAGLA